MIIVWGSFEASEEHMDRVLELSLQHVRRSRQEPGCVSHSVQIDVENRNRLVFIEEWETMSALQTHFKVPESGEFIAAVSQQAVSPPVMKIFDATQVN